MKESGPADYVTTREIPLDELTPYPGNAKRGDVEAIRASLRRNGQYRSLIVREIPDGPLIVLAGNHTMQALRAEGATTARCEVVRCDESTARRINLADNRTAELGGYDNAALSALLGELAGDFDGTGFTDAAVTQVLADVAKAAEEPKGAQALTDEEAQHADADGPDDTEPAAIVTRPGDVWLLGRHRLMCGDSRNPQHVVTLLDGHPVNLAFTSPPYASQRTYDETSGFEPIPPDEYVDWFEPVQAAVRSHLAEDGSWLVNIKEHAEDGQRHLYVKDLTLAHVRRWGWRFVDEFAWTKSGVPGKWPNRLKNGWEPVFHFTGSGSIKFRQDSVSTVSDDVFEYGGKIPASKTCNVGWSGSDVETGSGHALPSNVVHVHTSPASMQDADHSAAFPVALPRWFVRLLTDPDDRVYDPFSGSGSTILAADAEGRIGYGMEIFADYCDRTLRRWQKRTGVVPVLAATGQPHDFLADDNANP